MCGIAGIVDLKGVVDLDRSIRSMTDRIQKRGPDDFGYWTDAERRIALGHRRLSILDLSQSGHQPMLSSSGRFVIVFNGEIYNHLEIRREIAANNRDGGLAHGIQWRGHSDTETILAAIDAWGIEVAINKLVGMFAFAVWDRINRTLNLVRDRIGEKPLYYGWCGDLFLFASELKAFRGINNLNLKISENALRSYFQFGYIPGPLSIFEGVYKLAPGSYATIPISQVQDKVISVQKYWDLSSLASETERVRDEVDEKEVITHVDELITRSVKQQLISDVPLGAFLSGGIDSSLVVAKMQEQSTRPVNTFTIGFENTSYNEATYAHEVAKHIGTNHTELYLSTTDIVSAVEEMPLVYDEPFADSSQIPTYLVAKLARQHVTVALSGDGADEIFGGYNRYFKVPPVWDDLEKLPLSARQMLSGMIKKLPSETIERGFGFIFKHMPRRLRVPQLGEKIRKSAGMVEAQDFRHLYLFLLGYGGDDVVLSNKQVIDTVAICDLPHLEKAEWMMLVDTLGYLPDDVLVKVDRAAMANSLETRAPFLDHRLIEYAWRLPSQMKMRGGKGKWLLRQIIKKYLPENLFDRPKTGFGVPVSEWLRGPLKDWGEYGLRSNRTEHEKLIDVQHVNKLWLLTSKGANANYVTIWRYLMYSVWFENWHK